MFNKNAFVDKKEFYFFVTLRCTKLNLLRSLFSYFKIKYITVTVSGKAEGAGDFHYPNNVTTRSLYLKSL